MKSLLNALTSPQSMLLMGALSALLGPLVPWTDLRPAPNHSAVSLRFDDLRLHLEVDLPAPDRMHLLGKGTAALMDLPAEVVLQASDPAAIRELRIFDASGQLAFDLVSPAARGLGVSEVLLECRGSSLREAIQNFPAGAYFADGITRDGRPISGSVSLSHRFPGLFRVNYPLPDEVVLGNEVRLDWTPSQGAVRYHLEVEQKELGFEFETSLSARETAFSIPANFLKEGMQYSYSLSVEGDTDNQLELEGSFWLGQRSL